MFKIAELQQQHTKPSGSAMDLRVLQVIVVTWARWICLICMPETQGPQARGLKAYVHIRQITRAHVRSNMYHF